jgi:thiol:disulfide interchange protein
MIERILVIAALVGLVLVLRWYLSRASERARQQTATVPADLHGQPGIVALTAPGCVQCERLQKPALARIRDQRSDIRITTADISEHRDLVSRLGILTVPTTLVHAADGTIHHVNLGYTDDVTLYNQLAVVSAPPHCV